jgi:hypothetical protein
LAAVLRSGTDTRITDRVCSGSSGQVDEHDPFATSDSRLNMKNSPSAFPGFAMTTAFIGFAHSADNRYGSLRSSVVKGKARDYLAGCAYGRVQSRDIDAAG